MKIDQIKKEFPIFDEKIQNNDLVYLDSANSSQKPKIVIDRINEFYTKQFSNVGRSVHYLAVAATNMYENTRSSVQKYINAEDKNEIVFTKGATEALNLVANTLGQKYLEEGDEVIITELEHHSNYVPWHFLRKSKNIKINFAEINEFGEVPIENIEKLITAKTKIIAVNHLSNVTGAILPIKEITQLAHAKGIIVVVDGCQGAPHLKIDVQDLDCDFYAISCHKMYGPTGLGILYGKKKWLEELPPYQGGGGMIKEVKKDRISYGDLPNKYEAGTMATAQVIAFDQSIKFLEKVGIENIIKHEKELLKIDVQDLDCDFYAISCHKMYGPTGLGVLYGKKKWLEELPPYQGGGGMIKEVKKDRISYGDLPNKYEAGTMATAQVIAFDQSIKFLEKVGIENIIKHEKELIEYGQEILKKNNSVKLIGNPKNKGGVLSFTIEGVHPHDIATILDEDGVAIRAGHHCCQILHDKLGIPASARASVGIYNTKEDLDQLNESINKCKKIFDL